MLSPLGGAAMTSSGPACSLDSWSGNSRQDETHPDTLTAPTLPTVTDEDEVLPRIFSLPQSFKISESGHKKKKCWVFGRFQNQLHFMSIVLFIVVFSVFISEGK